MITYSEKSLDRISSIEQLTDYIKVTNPSVWIILGAIVVLMISVLIWSVFGTLVAKNGYFSELIVRQRLDDSGFIEATTVY